MSWTSQTKKLLIASLAIIGGYVPDRMRDRWMAGAATGLGVAGIGANALLSAFGFSAVAHSSGAVILTGAGGYIAGTYGLASIVAFFTAPLILVVFAACTVCGLFVLLKRKLGRRT